MKKTLDDYLRALSKERRDKVEARAAEIVAEQMTLPELRKAKLKSQQELAGKLSVKQAEISKMERRKDMYLSTLKNYVEAMGGKLEIVAWFPDSPPVLISQFDDQDGDDALDA